MRWHWFLAHHPLQWRCPQFWTYWAWPSLCFREKSHIVKQYIYMCMCITHTTISFQQEVFWHQQKLLSTENRNPSVAWEWWEHMMCLIVFRGGDQGNDWFHILALYQFMGKVQSVMSTQWCYWGLLDNASGVRLNWEYYEVVSGQICTQMIKQLWIRTK